LQSGDKVRARGNPLALSSMMSAKHLFGLGYWPLYQRIKKIMAAFSDIHLRFKFQALSPVTENPSFDLSYFTTFTTQDLTDVQDLVTFLTASLSSIPSGGASAPYTYLSSDISRTALVHLVDVFDVTNHITGGAAGSPVLMSSFTIPSAGAVTNLPDGCCGAITLQAPYGTDVEFAPGTRPRARDRGRIYYGPLNNSAVVNEAVTNRPILTTGFRTDMTHWIKAINVHTSAPHTVVWNLGVWSRKNGAMKSLQETWIDDRPDYQRRRSGPGVTRTVLGLP
jgi:hypothetical protein